MKRLDYLGLAIVVIILGLASRRFRGELPTFVGEYSGDALWALMVYLLVSTLLPGQRMISRGTVALGLAFLVEVSQLYHATWIDAIRATRLGGLVLGFGFLWTDFVCYTVGVATGVVIEWTVTRTRTLSSKPLPEE